MARTSSKSATTTAPASTTTSGSPPAHTIRYGKLRAAIWKNEGQSGPFYSVTFSRSYQDDQNAWKDATNFSVNDLPLLAKLANDSHSWITWQTKRAADEAREREGK